MASNLSLANKYRPKTWDDVTEQASIVQILTQQVKTKTYARCYLFTGGAGTGKTTNARIFSTAINGKEGVAIEIDAASNSSVERVRQIIAEANQNPIDCYFKVYILDECHTFSNAAWQAFLKCLEQPPARAFFIFCTTDPQKIPKTILSRIQRYDFQKISHAGIVKRLKYICEQEGYTNFEQGIDYIAKLADGGMRDAITMLDKCQAFSKEISLPNVIECLGIINYDKMFELTDNIVDQKDKNVVMIINELYQKGIDLKTFMNEYQNFILDINKYILFQSFDYIKIPQTYQDKLNYTIKIDLAKKYFSDLLDITVSIKDMIKWEASPKSTIEIMLLKATRM